MDQLLVTPLAISGGAILGALSRYYLSIGLIKLLGDKFPYGTLTVNLSGALLMGFVATLALGQMISPTLQLLLATGFLGSYTTFSTYALDTAALGKSRGEFFALCYWAGSAIGGVIGLEIGISLARGLL